MYTIGQSYDWAHKGVSLTAAAADWLTNSKWDFVLPVQAGHMSLWTLYIFIYMAAATAAEAYLPLSRNMEKAQQQQQQAEHIALGIAAGANALEQAPFLLDDWLIA